MKCCIVKLAAACDRPRHSLKKFVANTLGIGCGPIIIALAYFFFHDDVVDAAGLTNGAQISMLTAQWQLTMTITVLIGAILLYPSLEDRPQSCQTCLSHRACRRRCPTSARQIA